jgi:hypothetical protein
METCQEKVLKISDARYGRRVGAVAVAHVLQSALPMRSSSALNRLSARRIGITVRRQQTKSVVVHVMRSAHGWG